MNKIAFLKITFYLFVKQISCESQITYSFFFLFSSTLIEERIDFVQIFDFRLLMDLHVLGRPEHELTISGKCLPVCVFVYGCVCLCVCDKNFVASIAQELIKRI